MANRTNPYRNAEGYPDPTPYEAERHMKAQLTGKRSKAAGEHFEHMIDAACSTYLDRGIAKIQKTPEPMKPIGPKDKLGRFLACYTRQAQPDYGGTLRGGQSICFEAKHTDNDSIKQSRVTKEQGDDLEAHHKLGAITFVLVSFGLCDFYRIPWPVWRDMAGIYGRKYVRQDDLAKYKVPAAAGSIRLLEGIEITLEEKTWQR
ncbi:MAG: Holliday junction resolvase RecU [Candidatus Spyradocola sp.]